MPIQTHLTRGEEKFKWKVAVFAPGVETGPRRLTGRPL